MASDRAHARHDRDAVIDAALRLLDEHGLPELTMRRLAGALEVQPSALYWHVENKQTLLAAVADRILAAARPAPGPGLDWRDATRHEVLAIRDALLAYRDGAEVVLSTRALGLGGDDALQRISAALGRGHDATTARRAATALLHLVLGDATLVQQRIQADSLGVTTRTAALDPTGPTADVDTVRTGLELVLDGLAAASGSAASTGSTAGRSRTERRA